MGPLARALIGGALCSCLILYVHPLSRPCMTGLIPQPREADRILTASSGGTGPLDIPQSTAEAGLWMQLGCARLASGQKLSREELESLLRISQGMQRWGQQFDNAFWPQMEAVFLDQLGDNSGARRAWEVATKCSNWRDYQSERLLDEADTNHAKLAWHVAGLYYQRRFYVGQAIYDYAKRAIDQTGKDSRDDLEFRYATLVNAHLMAIGAQSVDILRFAGQIADMALQPLPRPVMGADGKPKESYKAIREKARGQFYAALITLGFKDQADSAKRDYDLIDSQPVLTRQFRPSENAARIAAVSVFTSTLPGSLLLLAILGAILWPLGRLIINYSYDHAAFNLLPILAASVLLGLGAFLLKLPSLAIAVIFLCTLFIVLSPKNERARIPPELGSVFSWTIRFFALLFIGAVAACLAAVSTPAKLLLPSIIDASPGVIGNQFVLILGGVAAMLFAMMLLLAPMWAFVRRIRTPFVLGHAMKAFGMSLVAIGLAGVVLLGPICVYVDSMEKQTMKELVGNEPLHYYNEFQ